MIRVSGDDRLGRILPGFEGLHHGCTALGLDDGQLGDSIDQPHVEHFFEALVNAQRPQPAADRLDIPVGRTPAELFDDLIGDGFHRLAGRDGAGAAVDRRCCAVQTGRRSVWSGHNCR